MKSIIMFLLAILPMYAIAGTGEPKQKDQPKKESKEAAPANMLKGSVGKMGDYQPIPGVTLTFVSSDGNLKKSVQTDAEGKFTVNDIPPGTYKVRFEKNGFEPGTYESLAVREDGGNYGFLMYEK